jgi:hypothetical protein
MDAAPPHTPAQTTLPLPFPHPDSADGSAADVPTRVPLVPGERRVRLAEEHTRTGRRHAPQPFDRDACVERAQALLTAGCRGGHRLGDAMAPQLSWQWPQRIDQLCQRRSNPQEHGPLSEVGLQAWAQDTARRPGFIHGNTSPLLRPFFTRAEIAPVPLAMCATDADGPPRPQNRWHAPGPWRKHAFAPASLCNTPAHPDDTPLDRPGERPWLPVARLCTAGAFGHDTPRRAIGGHEEPQQRAEFGCVPRQLARVWRGRHGNRGQIRDTGTAVRSKVLRLAPAIAAQS